MGMKNHGKTTTTKVRSKIQRCSDSESVNQPQARPGQELSRLTSGRPDGMRGCHSRVAEAVSVACRDLLGSRSLIWIVPFRGREIDSVVGDLTCGHLSAFPHSLHTPCRRFPFWELAVSQTGWRGACLYHLEPGGGARHDLADNAGVRVPLGAHAAHELVGALALERHEKTA